jgi:hypothetical protein
MSRSTRTLLASAALAGFAGAQGAVPKPRAAALASITGCAIRSHMEILAADDMEGREAGTEGFRKAAEYVTDQYRAIGLRPLGDGGSYLQSVEFFETRLEPASARLVLNRQEARLELVFRDDFVRSGGFGAAHEEVTAPLVFVGYGIFAPEYGHDDFDGVDPADKILVVLSGAPPRFDTDQRAFYSSPSGKEALALQHGAVGVITVRTPVDQARRPWSRYLPGIGSPDLRWLEEEGEPYLGFPALTGSATLSEAGAEELFAFSGHDLEQLFARHAEGQTGSFDMGVSATLLRRSIQRTVSSTNLIGWLPGRDPSLKDEYVIYTAHLDHLGLQPGEDGDELYNGAYDNAAGVAVLLEIARAMTGLEGEPRRSVIFAVVTAEEHGQQGSSYLAKHPPVAVDRLVANINIDMPYLGFPVADIEAFGAEHSSLLEAVQWATAQLGMGLTPDSMPQEVRFIRSDQFSFVKEGIPALAFKPGAKSSDPEIDGAAMLTDFLKNHYHRPSDDLSLPYSREGAERFARAALLLGLMVAAEGERPHWNEGDFFGRNFGRKGAEKVRKGEKAKRRKGATRLLAKRRKGATRLLGDLDSGGAQGSS